MHDSVYMKFKNRQNQFVVIGVRGWLLLVWLLTARVHEGAFMTVRNILYLNLRGENTGICIWKNSLSSTQKICVFHYLCDVPQLK